MLYINRILIRALSHKNTYSLRYIKTATIDIVKVYVSVKYWALFPIQVVQSTFHTSFNISPPFLVFKLVQTHIKQVYMSPNKTCPGVALFVCLFVRFVNDKSDVFKVIYEGKLKWEFKNVYNLLPIFSKQHLNSEHFVRYYFQWSKIYSLKFK